MKRIDAHHHVWDLTIRPQTWMDDAGDAYALLHRSFLIDEYVAVATAAGVGAGVVVQTVGDEAETAELLSMSTTQPLVAGVIGWVDLRKRDVADRITRFRDGIGGHRLCGLRHQVHDELDVGWITRKDVRRGIEAVGAHGLAYDLLLKPTHLAPALSTVDALPNVRFVIDHLGKPPVASGELEPWASGIRALAARPNTWCKLSGLLHEARWSGWTVDDLRPYVKLVVEVFGPRRMMSGSDWPVCTLSASYGETLLAHDAALPTLSADELRAIHVTTAAAVYDLAIDTSTVGCQ